MEEKFFDPNAAAALGSGIYGLPCSADEAEIIIIPVEWELTTSYNRGTVNGPQAVFDGSMQVDLHHHDYPDVWKRGIWMDEFPQEESIVLSSRYNHWQNSKTQEVYPDFPDIPV